MGRRIQGQRRGRGTPTFRAPSHRYKADLSHRKVEDGDVVSGTVVDIEHDPARSAPVAAVEFEDSEAQSASGSRTQSGDGEEFEYDADTVLVAVGREPGTDTLNLEAIELETDENGFIPTDDRARTHRDNVFAVGDVAGEPMLAHKGIREGEVAAEVIAGEPSALDHQAVPAVVFTDPEIATVGMTQAEAAEAGFEPVVGQMPMQASGRALTMNEDDGFVRVVADDETGFLLGAQIVAPEASEMIAELGLAVEMGATVEDVANTIHTHPTLAEATMEAVKNAEGAAIHTLNR
jgi:dihydrolipoamide dehydrogenase